MPIPPPPPVVWALLGAAKMVAVEYLPALSSVSLAAWLIRAAWQQLPDWIREDAVWRRGEQPIEGDSGQAPERLSTVWDRIQSLIRVAESLLQSPVPHLPAALLAHLQAASEWKAQPASVRCRNNLYQEAGPLWRPEKERTGSALLPTSSNTPRAAIATPTKFDEPAVLRRALDWAVWAYSLHNANVEKSLETDLARDGFVLQTSVRANRPGSVGYYVALSDDTLLIAIKGTSSLEDILTDTCGRSLAYEASIATEGTPIEVRARVDDKVLDVPILLEGATTMANEASSIEVVSGHERVLFAGGETTSWLEDDANDQVRCHEGVLLSARTVARDIEGWVHTYAVQGGRRLLLVGHSLGASAACLVAMILRLRFCCLADLDDRLHVYAFAPPPVLDHDSALACSSYVTTIVHNADLIPRASLVNLALHLEILRNLSNRLVEGEVAPTTPAGLAAFVQRVYGGTRSDKEDWGPLWTLQESLDSLAKARDIFPLRHPDHLYIPGRVLLFYQDWQVGDLQKQNLKQQHVPQQPYVCRVTDGTALALQSLELDGFRWMGDHTTAAYYACLESVLGQQVESSPNVS
jgi:hypothetical protein